MSSADQHLDEDQIALLALGEDLPSAARDHLQHCAVCEAKVADLHRVVSAARSSAGDEWQPTVPSAALWDRISDELELGSDPVGVLRDEMVRPSSEVRELGNARSKRRWPTSTLVAASVVGVIAGTVLALAGTALLSDQTPSPPVAQATPHVLEKTVLAPLPDHTGGGSAEIVQTSRGSELIVDVDDMTEGDGFYEVWLINPKTKAMVGLGSLNGLSGRFPIPEGLDLSQYSLVDVSIEPFDGDPTHSGNSVVRGELAA